MHKIDPCDHDTSLEEVFAKLDIFLDEISCIFVRGDDRDKITRPVYAIIFMITGGRIPLIKEMSTD